MHSLTPRSFGHALVTRRRFSQTHTSRILANVVFTLLAIVALRGHGRASEADKQTPEIGAQKTFTLTIHVDGVRNSAGQIGMLMFNSRRGWPDELKDALRGSKVQAVAGTTTIKVEGLAPGDYGVLIIHDENLNQKLDHDWKGLPSEQWGMSNNPRVYLAAPSFERARFHIVSDAEIHIALK